MNEVSAYILARVGHYDYCFRHPIEVGVCADLWVWVMAGSFALGAYLIIRPFVGYYFYQRKVEVALRADAHRQAVNSEAIEALKWTGDDHYEFR